MEQENNIKLTIVEENKEQEVKEKSNNVKTELENQSISLKEIQDIINNALINKDYYNDQLLWTKNPNLTPFTTMLKLFHPSGPFIIELFFTNLTYINNGLLIRHRSPETIPTMNSIKSVYIREPNIEIFKKRIINALDTIPNNDVGCYNSFQLFKEFEKFVKERNLVK